MKIKAFFIIQFCVFNIQLWAQNQWYRVDEPGSKICFFVDTSASVCKIGTHLKTIITYSFTENLICINFKKDYDLTDKWGCLNDNGDTIINGKYLEPFSFYNGIAKVSVEEIIDNKSGELTGYYCKYIDKKGNEICDKKFESEFSYDMLGDWAVCKSGNFWYILSKRGKLKELSVDYEFVSPFSDGLACCKRINQYTAYIDTTTFSVFETSNQNFIGNFTNGFAQYSSIDGKFGFINKKGKPVTQCIFQKTKSFSQNFAAVKLYDKWGFIDNTGKIIIKPVFDDVHSYSEELAGVKINDKWGYTDKSGKIVIQNKFSEIKDFYSNIAAAKDTNDRWGYINKNGEWLIKPQFVDADNFDANGFAIVLYTDRNSFKKGILKQEQKALISKNGKIVWYSGEKPVLK
ncbi:MAG: WG repeat-containing protein [Bacteroidia bacterium]|nr:WG repeat-containing protein [Bacteroidia bacterium]